MNRLLSVERNHYLLLQLGVRSFYELGVLNSELGIVLGFACDLELNIFEFAHNSCFGKCLYGLSATFLLNQKIIVRILVSVGEKT